MQHEREEISAPDGVALVLERWAPPSDARFAVCIVHGNAEHVGRYADVAADLGAAGGLVFGMDRRGQGESGGPRGHVDSFETFASDLRHVLLHVADAGPAEHRPENLPWFILGHSAGGLVTLLYLLDHADAVPLRGTVLSNPLLELALKVNPVTAMFGRAAASVLPKLTVPSNIPAAFVSRDPDQVARYEADTRRFGKVSTRWFVAMNRAAERVKAEVPELTAPLLWAIGTGDRIVDAAASERAFASLRDPEGNDQTLRRFDDYYHELHNEPEPDRSTVLGAYIEWIEQRL